MSDLMRPLPFTELLNRIFEEYQQNRSIFGIPEAQFYKKQDDRSISVFGERCETPLGPAAGPHTQLSQNIVTSWLAGGRFMELKTVQKMDTLEIEKPCIDAEDECFNTEWSTEYTLPKAFDEYVKAWIALYLMEEIFDPRFEGEAKSFIFNMSVGYDLAGIKTVPMQTFIDSMMDASEHPVFKTHIEELREYVSNTAYLERLELDEDCIKRLQRLPDLIPSRLVEGVTLSTMHGCPPHEIEAICRYMLEEKGINTFVKLNPTLLGYHKVREILDNAGFDYIGLSEESFSHDLQLADAKAMLHRLVDLGKEKGLGFGVKLTNTLGTINAKGVLPGDEMYMSGRALFPLSINVAKVLSDEFNGQLPISYSGGASKLNIKEIFETGIRPITMATDLLKPGGYLRLTDCARELDSSDDWNHQGIDLDKLTALAEKSLVANYTQKEWRGPEEIRINKLVPLTDCYVAPCVTACPISQDIPEYLRLMGQKKYGEALELIYARNPLPSITGHICDHQCQFNCTRRDYEGAVNIREMKRIALKKGWNEYEANWRQAIIQEKHPVAVLGAGPAGLSAAYFLTRLGHPVTVFEKEKNAGGVVKNIIPHFRIPAEAIEHDIDFVTKHGVNFEYGCNPNLTIDELKAQGFEYICLGIGADKGNPMKLEGGNTNIHKSLHFLKAYNDGNAPELGKHVVVVGAGNTAMDSARAALKVDGVDKVTIVYRRTIAEMPAYKEEYDEAVEDGVQFMFLSNPERFTADGTLTVREMELGEADAGGRRRPVATDRTIDLKVDALITAVGEQTNRDVLTKMGVPMGEDGWPQVNEETCETGVENVFLMGDAHTGPSNIVGAIAGAHKAAETILEREEQRYKPLTHYSATRAQEVYARKGIIPTEMVNSDQEDAFIEQEAGRCLECSYICSKCVDVCPNRANISLPVPGFDNPFQTLHLDAYCNECGNCGRFCPWDSKPYEEKVTIFSLEEDFHDSNNPGFFVNGEQVLVRQGDAIHNLTINDQGQIEGQPDDITDMAKIIQFVHQKHSYLLGPVEL
ncbi:putative selenate reductase subunit YgfK [Ferrimonas aestuarii]|uniref:dihydrouracil dehydrogenase (NAD(+)) n=1 Tax=Ferrimonas aestuarii TaxID=2569539 RepID=A0A4U1BJU5_9GAMM|nr:putative selenate reductase subunit YgfK [Ferrimonas aestuarii]TKB51854.1 putative selenate reductase subunit YgfK [Ferrimonas aestuarii]